MSTYQQRKNYEDALLHIQLKAKANEPTDPVALLKFQMEQEACARIRARKYSGFPEPGMEDEEGEAPEGA